MEIRELQRDEHTAAVGVLARGMRDNPLHIAAFGPDPDRRHRGLERMFTTLLRVMNHQQPLCAVDAGTIVGVTGVAPARTCQPGAGARLRFIPTFVAMGPSVALRIVRWLNAWHAHDLEEPHTHLGPLAVDAPLQGRGIGSQILREHCDRLDAAAQVGYLETDKAENVRLYERHGFEVIADSPVIGVPNWYMRRSPR